MGADVGRRPARRGRRRPRRVSHRTRGPAPRAARRSGAPAGSRLRCRSPRRGQLGLNGGHRVPLLRCFQRSISIGALGRVDAGAQELSGLAVDAAGAQVAHPAAAQAPDAAVADAHPAAERQARPPALSPALRMGWRAVALGGEAARPKGDLPAAPVLALTEERRAAGSARRAAAAGRRGPPSGHSSSRAGQEDRRGTSRARAQSSQTPSSWAGAQASPLAGQPPLRGDTPGGAGQLGEARGRRSPTRHGVRSGCGGHPSAHPWRPACGACPMIGVMPLPALMKRIRSGTRVGQDERSFHAAQADDRAGLDPPEREMARPCRPPPASA